MNWKRGKIRETIVGPMWRIKHHAPGARTGVFDVVGGKNEREAVKRVLSAYAREREIVSIERLPGGSDARWFVDEISLGLAHALTANTPTSEALRSAVARAADAFARVALRPDAPPEHMPCASFIMARLLGATLELTNLGDCRILHREASSGRVTPFGVSRLGALDAIVENEFGALMGRRATGSFQCSFATAAG